jgi:hypothetical protein
VPHSGLAQIYAGHQAADFFGVPYGTRAYLDVFGRAQAGVVYAGGSKIESTVATTPMIATSRCLSTRRARSVR